MKILITGSTGFVGRNVKEYLEKQNKYDIYAPDSKELDCLDEQRTAAYLEKNRFDYILHFAVYGDGVDKTKDRSKTVEYNLRIFFNFANHAHLFGRMYYSGSGAEYDKRYDIKSVREEDVGRTMPVDPYGVMKYTIGQIIENSSSIYNFRLFGIFGKYEYYPQKYISNVCCKAVKGIPLTMRQNVYFDYLWVDDFARMTEYFLHHEPRYHTYNMVSGQKISLKEICDRVLAVSGKDLPVFVCREGLANEYTASNKRFMDECRGFSYTPYETSIEYLYRWYEEHEADINLYDLLY